MMRVEFRIPEPSLSQHKFRSFLRLTFWVLATSAAWLGGLYWFRDHSILEWQSIFFLGGLTAVFVYLGLWRQLLSKLHIMRQYRLIFDGEHIVQRSSEGPDKVIECEKITSIIRSAKGRIFIIGETAHKVIQVPRQLAREQKLQEKLKQIKSIKHKKSRIFSELGRIALGTLSNGLLLVFLFSKSDAWALGSGGLVLLGMLVGLFGILRQERHFNRMVLMVLAANVLMLALMLVKMLRLGII